MTASRSPAEIAVTYLEAWALRDRDTTAGLIAVDAS
jgi:hypothetical protein